MVVVRILLNGGGVWCVPGIVGGFGRRGSFAPVFMCFGVGCGISEGSVLCLGIWFGFGLLGEVVD